MLTITKEFAFEAAHLLENHPSKCKNLHGHSYRLLVTVTKKELDNNMIIDFADLKKVVNEELIDKIDHSFIYNTNTDKEYVKEIATALAKYGLKMFAFNTRSTCEEMSKVFFEMLQEKLKEINIELVSIELYEGPGSYATYSR